MFEITVSQRFKAGHAVREAGGEFEPPHMHDWRVEAVVAGQELDGTGCVADFAVVQRFLRSCLTAWDGKNLNDLPMFLDVPPSTEFLAKCLFDQMESLLQEEGAVLKKITVWETENCGAAYVRQAPLF